jgi:hypothetical protein
MVVTMTGGTTALGILMRAQIELATSDANGVDVDDGHELFIAAWCVHPGLIPEQKILAIPEPTQPHDPHGFLFL